MMLKVFAILVVLLLACDAAPASPCKCNATSCICDGADASIPRCPPAAQGRGVCSSEPPCMDCTVTAGGAECTCRPDDAGKHWFCVGTGYGCTDE